MSVFFRGKSWYVQYYPEGRAGPRIRLRLPGIETQEQALEFERTIRASCHEEEPDDIDPTSDTIAAVTEHYLAWIHLNKRSRTYDDVATSLAHVARILPGVHLRHITSGHIELYKRSRLTETTRQHGHKHGRPIKPRTINKELAWFSGLMRWARKHGFKVPLVDIERLPYSRPFPVILTPQQCMAIIQEADPAYRCFFAFCYFCGLRRAEVATLKWQDIDYQTRIVTVYGKGGKYRLVPIPPLLLQWLGEPKEGSVFAGRGTPTRYWVQQALTRATKKAGITRKVGCHLLRHSMASHLMAAGVSMRIIQDTLGHAAITTTQFYTHVNMDDKRHASDTLMEGLGVAPRSHIPLPPPS